MSDTFKVLGQASLAATTLTDLYTVPGATSAVISTVVICNRGSAATTFRLSVAIAGAANANQQYLSYDTPVVGNDSVTLTLGVSLATTDVIRGYAGNTNLSFNIFGLEIT